MPPRREVVPAEQISPKTHAPASFDAKDSRLGALAIALLRRLWKILRNCGPDLLLGGVPLNVSRMSDSLFVLLVEDDEADARFTERALGASERNIHVRHCSSGEGALEWLRGADQDIRTLVLLDWHLPQMSGGDLLRVMAREPRLAAIPVVILSGDGTEDALNDSCGLGARAFVQKPNSPSGYREMVSAIVSFWDVSDLN